MNAVTRLLSEISMNRNSILIGSGYFAPPGKAQETADFHNIWYENLRKYLGELPQIHLFCNGGSVPPVNTAIGKTFCLGNTMHVGALIHGEKDYKFCGWSSVMMSLLWMAYNEEKDLLFIEQDALVFGEGWVDELLKELGSASVIFGRKHLSGPNWMPTSQSLFYVRHSFIPAFTASYCSMPRDGDVEWIPELKFLRMMERDWKNYRMMSWGYDRERPLGYDDPYWYAQKFTPEEMAELRRRNLL